MVECMRTAAKLPERNKRKMEEENTNEKQTKHIYISGPITGTKDYMQRFEKSRKGIDRKRIFCDQSGKSQCNAATGCNVGRIYKSVVDAAVNLYRGVHDAGLERKPWGGA